MAGKSTESLCWSCAKACTKGCSWATDFTPVKGWVADKTVNAAGVESYSVMCCPEFVFETTENKNRDLSEEGCVALVEALLEITRDDYIKGTPAMQKQIERFLLREDMAKIHRLEDPEAVIRMLRKDAEEYRRRRAQSLMI